MTTPYIRSIKLTPRDLQARLKRRVSRGEHPVAIAQELDILLNAKDKLRRANAKTMQHNRLWKELLMPLKAEMKNAVTMCGYKGGSPERREALEGFLMVLSKLHDRLILDSHKGFTPAAMGKAQNKANNGSHWTDWVPPSVKRKVLELFDAVPDGGVRKKIPFERKVPAALGKKLKKRLLERTIKELDAAKFKANKSELARDDDTHKIDLARITNIEVAINWINDADDTEALPTTWSGFFKG